MEDDSPFLVTGLGIPPRIASFTDIYVDPVLNIIKKRFNSLTTLQKSALPVLEGGHNLMACAPTGSGKTLSLCLRIISQVMKTTRSKSFGSFALPVALILCPTEKLSLQVFEEVKKFCGQTDVKVAYGGGVVFEQASWKAEDVDIMVATPKQICMMIDETNEEKASVLLSQIKYLALDEADQMLMEFRKDITRIVNCSDMPPADARQTMLFSATLSAEIQMVASKYLSRYIFLSVGRVGSSEIDFPDFNSNRDNAATFGGATSGDYENDSWNSY